MCISFGLACDSLHSLSQHTFYYGLSVHYKVKASQMTKGRQKSGLKAHPWVGHDKYTFCLILKVLLQSFNHPAGSEPLGIVVSLIIRRWGVHSMARESIYIIPVMGRREDVQKKGFSLEYASSTPNNLKLIAITRLSTVYPPFINRPHSITIKMQSLTSPGQLSFDDFLNFKTPTTASGNDASEFRCRGGL